MSNLITVMHELEVVFTQTGGKLTAWQVRNGVMVEVTSASALKAVEEGDMSLTTPMLANGDFVEE
jgi:hypothetical protein